MSAGFAHLHVRSGFSYGFGVATPAELLDVASEMGMGALALTDRDGLYGVPKFLEATWLSLASELQGGVGECAHAAREPVRLRGARGRIDLVRPERYRRGSARRVVRVLERWREVRAWWDEEARTDRLVFRVLLAGGAVAELALERPGGWFLIGIAD